MKCLFVERKNISQVYILICIGIAGICFGFLTVTIKISSELIWKKIRNVEIDFIELNRYSPAQTFL